MEIELPIQMAIRELENGLFIGEAILFPEISRFHDSIARIEPGVAGSVRAFYEKLPIRGLAGRILNSRTHIHETEIMIEPVRRSMIWRKSAPMVFHSAVWRHGSGVWLAYIPALSAAAAGRTRPELEERIRRQVISILHGDRINLEKIVRLQRTRQLHLRERTVNVRIPELKTRVDRRHHPAPGESELSKTGVELAGRRLKPAFEVDGMVSQLADVLTETAPSSVLLIGPSGAGESAVVHETARKKRLSGLSFVRFYEMSGAGIVAVQIGSGDGFVCVGGGAVFGQGDEGFSVDGDRIVDADDGDDDGLDDRDVVIVNGVDHPGLGRGQGAGGVITVARFFIC